ncbi:putative Acetyltransferase [Novosphingobium sp. PY1]|nr:putative Acetyltransferase [Novosphingobium sp. PY1]
MPSPDNCQAQPNATAPAKTWTQKAEALEGPKPTIVGAISVPNPASIKSPVNQDSFCLTAAVTKNPAAQVQELQVADWFASNPNR